MISVRLYRNVHFPALRQHIVLHLQLFFKSISGERIGDLFPCEATLIAQSYKQLIVNTCPGEWRTAQGSSLICTIFLRTYWPIETSDKLQDRVSVVRT
jgi:hypothetical protein